MVIMFALFGKNCKKQVYMKILGELLNVTEM